MPIPTIRYPFCVTNRLLRFDYFWFNERTILYYFLWKDSKLSEDTGSVSSSRTGTQATGSQVEAENVNACNAGSHRSESIGPGVSKVTGKLPSSASAPVDVRLPAGVNVDPLLMPRQPAG